MKLVHSHKGSTRLAAQVTRMGDTTNAWKKEITCENWA